MLRCIAEGKGQGKKNNVKKYSLNSWIWLLEVRWQNFFPFCVFTLKYWECQEDGPGSARWLPAREDEAMGRSWGTEAPPEHEEELLNSLLLYCTGTACPEKVWSPSPSLDIPQPSEHSSVLCALGWSCLSRRLDQADPSSLTHSGILWGKMQIVMPGCVAVGKGEKPIILKNILWIGELGCERSDDKIFSPLCV